ncbi:MAG: crotonyl-CoA carboxylase/reductase, partial [Mycobacteriales bacterium]
MKEIREAILAGDTPGGAFAALPIPESYRGVVVRKDEQEMFAGLAVADKDPRKSLHVDEVATPEL